MRFKKMPGVAANGIGSPAGLAYLPSVDKIYALTNFCYYRGTPGLYTWVPELAEITNLQTWDRNVIQLFWTEEGEPNHSSLDADWCAGHKFGLYENKLYFATSEFYLSPLGYKAKIWSYDGTTLTNEYTVSLLDADGYIGAYPADICVYNGVLYITLTESIVTYNGSTWSEITPGGITPEQREASWCNDYAGMGVHANKLYVSMANYDQGNGDQYYKIMVTDDGSSWAPALAYAPGTYGVEWGDNVFQSLISFNSSIYMLTDAEYVYAAKLYRWSGVTDESPVLVAEDVEGNTWRFFGPMTTCTQMPNQLLIGSFQCIKRMDTDENIVEITHIIPENTHGIDLTFEATYAEKSGVLYWVATCDALVGGSNMDPNDYYASEGYQLISGTRLYLPSDMQAPISPPFDVGGIPGMDWSEQDNAIRRKASPVITASAFETQALTKEEDLNYGGAWILFRQYITPPIAQAVELSGTVHAQIRGKAEPPGGGPWPWSDISPAIDIRICNLIGGNIRYVHAKDTDEPWNDVLTNRDFVPSHDYPSDKVINSPYITAQPGDRLIIEIGTFTGCEVEDGFPGPGDPCYPTIGTIEFGDTAASDLPEDITNTNQLNPWVEFSQDILFMPEVSGTRLYFSNIPETEYTPIGDLDPIGWWNATNIEEAVQNQLTLGAQNEGFEVHSRSWPYSSHGYILLGQFVSPPLVAGQTLSGTVKAQIRAMESDLAADMSLRIEIERYDKDGNVYWDDQYTDNKLFNVEPQSLTNEFATTLTNQQVVEGPLIERNWVDYNGNPQPLTLDGDRLLVLIGYISFKDDPTGYPGGMEFGTNGAIDLPENNTETSQYNPWIEFSQTLLFQGLVDLPTVVFVNVTDIDCMSAIGHAIITSDGGGTILEKGFVWSKLSNPTIDDEKVIVP